MPHNTEIAWVAGIFEGEGCVLVTTQGVLWVTVTNTDLRILDELKRICGGDICRGGITKTLTHVKRWRHAGSSADAFLKQILPYLKGNKKEEVELALQFESTRGTSGIRLSEEAVAKRMSIRLGLQALKKRRYPIAT